MINAAVARLHSVFVLFSRPDQHDYIAQAARWRLNASSDAFARSLADGAIPKK